MNNSWKKQNTDDPEYKRNVKIVAAITISLGLIASSILAYKINGAEQANAEALRLIRAEKLAEQ